MEKKKVNVCLLAGAIIISISALSIIVNMVLSTNQLRYMIATYDIFSGSLPPNIGFGDIVSIFASSYSKFGILVMTVLAWVNLKVNNKAIGIILIVLSAVCFLIPSIVLFSFALKETVRPKKPLSDHVDSNVEQEEEE